MISRFYRTEDQWRSIFEALKQTACPHCKAIGGLILYGFLRGYDENDHRRRSVRARRVFCNNRKTHNNGCGRTFSIWAADKIRRLSFGAISLWKVLKRIAEGSDKLGAFRQLDCTLSDSAPYRIWRRFERAQSQIRTALVGRCQAPYSKFEQPTMQVIAHLEAAFADESCPIIAFQNQTQTFFL